MGENELVLYSILLYIFDFMTKQDLTVVYLNLGSDLLHTSHVPNFTHHKR